MNLLRLTILGCLFFVLAGCSAATKSNKATASYPWHRPPDDLPQHQQQPKKPGQLDPF